MVLLAQRPKSQRPPKAEVEIMIKRSCLGTEAGKEEMQHLDLGRRIKVSEKMAAELCVWAGSGYYVSQEDDPSVDKTYTLTADRLKPIECEVRMRKERAEQRAEDDAFERAVRRSMIDRYGATPGKA